MGDQFRDDLRTRIARFRGVEINRLPVDYHGLVHLYDVHDSQERSSRVSMTGGSAAETPIASTAGTLLTQPPEGAQCWVWNRRGHGSSGWEKDPPWNLGHLAGTEGGLRRRGMAWRFSESPADSRTGCGLFR